MLLVPTEGDEDYALADFLTCSATGADPAVAALLERVAASAAGIECEQRGDDAAFPGVHPKDLALCQRIDTFAHALIAVPAGELLELEVI